MTIIHKERTSKADGMDFILSDETVDRMGDIIRADGWELGEFKKNPIALFGHRSDFPLGTWSNLRVEKKSLRGTLEIAAEGTSPRIDEVRRLVQAGVIRAVSVGFRSIEARPLTADPYAGMEFTKQELVECSLVSIPANPNALAIAKSLGISADVRALVFARAVPKPAPAVEEAPFTLSELGLMQRHLANQAHCYPANDLWARWHNDIVRQRMSLLRK